MAHKGEVTAQQKEPRHDGGALQGGHEGDIDYGATGPMHGAGPGSQTGTHTGTRRATL